MQHTTGSCKFNLDYMIQHFLNKKLKSKLKHLKVPRNQKVFKDLPKEKNIYEKILKRETKPVKEDTRYIKHYSKR